MCTFRTVARELNKFSRDSGGASGWVFVKRGVASCLAEFGMCAAPTYLRPEWELRIDGVSNSYMRPSSVRRPVVSRQRRLAGAIQALLSPAGSLGLGHQSERTRRR